MMGGSGSGCFLARKFCIFRSWNGGFGVFPGIKFNIMAETGSCKKFFTMLTVLFSKRKYNVSDENTIDEKCQVHIFKSFFYSSWWR